MPTDFSSLDKLVEFGLGIGIATQMMNTMNQTLARTAYPGVGINPGLCSNPGLDKAAVTLPQSYYIVRDERLAGPLSEQELSSLVGKGMVRADTFCWRPGLDSWRLAEDIPEVNKLLLLNS